jgi:hypothetical protein
VAAPGPVGGTGFFTAGSFLMRRESWKSPPLRPDFFLDLDLVNRNSLVISLKTSAAASID